MTRSSIVEVRTCRRDCENARARPDQHRLDEPRRAGIERRRQAHAVAGMNDGHRELAERPHVLHEPHEVVALRKRDPDLRQRAARPLDARGRRSDRRLRRRSRSGRPG